MKRTSPVVNPVNPVNDHTLMHRSAPSTVHGPPSTGVAPAPDPTMQYRAVQVARDEASRAPATWNEADRSVEVAFATEAPVMIYDYDRGEYMPEVLLMSGVQLPANRQAPLLDSHNRWSVSDQLGSNRDFRVDGDQLLGRSYFANTDRGREAAELVKDGHLTDWSVGYRIGRENSVYIEKGATAKVDGRDWQGPLILRTKWSVREVSVTPIGADDRSKARHVPASTPNPEEPAMSHLRKLCTGLGMPATATDDELRAFLLQHADQVRAAIGKSTDDEKTSIRAEIIDMILLRNEPPGRGQASDDDDDRALPPANVPGFDALARQIAEDTIRAERDRVAQIEAMGRQLQLPEETWRKAMRDGTSLEKAQVAFARAVIEDGANQQRATFQVTGDERDKLRAAGRDGLLLRMGCTPATPAPGATEIAGMTLRGMMEECLLRAGQPVPRGSVGELMERALTGSDFPYIFAGSAYQALQEGWNDETPTWSRWCEVGPRLDDFEIHTENRPGETDDLEEVAEGQEFPYDSRTESAPESYQMAKYGKVMMLTEEMVRGDRLGAFGDIAKQHGRAAARKVAEICYAVITANGTMGDSVALFAADHGNLATSTSAPGTTEARGTVATKLGEAVRAMRVQKDLRSLARLNIMPTYLLAPVALQESIEQHFGAFQPATSSNVNVYKTMFSVENRVYDPRLDDDSATAWYLIGPKGMTVRIRFLDGQQTPQLAREAEFMRDALKYKVRIGAVAYARDWRGLQKNPGTTG